jgi:hypothetical protein
MADTATAASSESSFLESQDLITFYRQVIISQWSKLRTLGSSFETNPAIAITNQCIVFRHLGFNGDHFVKAGD